MMRRTKLVASFMGAVAFTAMLVAGPTAANAEKCPYWVGDRCVFLPVGK